jgi:hypothetical protein
MALSNADTTESEKGGKERELDKFAKMPDLEHYATFVHREDVTEHASCEQQHCPFKRRIGKTTKINV